MSTDLIGAFLYSMSSQQAYSYWVTLFVQVLVYIHIHANNTTNSIM